MNSIEAIQHAKHLREHGTLPGTAPSLGAIVLGLLQAIDDATVRKDRMVIDCRANKEEAAQLRRLLGAALEDSDRLDWMNLHQASVEVCEPDPMPCVVQSSDDYKLSGRADPYDIREAIDAARKAS